MTLEPNPCQHAASHPLPPSDETDRDRKHFKITFMKTQLLVSGVSQHVEEFCDMDCKRGQKWRKSLEAHLYQVGYSFIFYFTI